MASLSYYSSWNGGGGRTSCDGSSRAEIMEIYLLIVIWSFLDFGNKQKQPCEWEDCGLLPKKFILSLRLLVIISYLVVSEFRSINRATNVSWTERYVVEGW